jgi:hypothetical protein
MNEDRGEARPPVCAKGHLIATNYTLEEVRTLEILVFYCEGCDVRWNATPEERDAFLQYLETRPDDAVPS